MSEIISDLKGRQILVTGGTGYLGTAISIKLSQLGAHVIINSRSENAYLNLEEKIFKLGGSCELALFDITNYLEMESFFANSGKLKVDGVVNNAYFGSGGTIESSIASSYQSSYEISVVAVQELFKHCLPFLRKSLKEGKKPSVVNICSMYGMVSPDPSVYSSPDTTNPPFYGAAKAALMHWTKYGACEFGKENIRFNSVSPGPFPAPRVAEEHVKFVDSLKKKIPLDRLGAANEIAGPVAFLLSDMASYITGSNLVVDGGWTAW